MSTKSKVLKEINKTIKKLASEHKLKVLVKKEIDVTNFQELKFVDVEIFPIMFWTDTGWIDYGNEDWVYKLYLNNQEIIYLTVPKYSASKFIIGDFYMYHQGKDDIVPANNYWIKKTKYQEDTETYFQSIYFEDYFEKQKGHVLEYFSKMKEKQRKEWLKSLNQYLGIKAKSIEFGWKYAKLYLDVEKEKHVLVGVDTMKKINNPNKGERYAIS